MQTEVAPRRWRRLASAESCLYLLGAGFAAGAQAADTAPAVVPPKPVVVQPTAAMVPPPSVPIVADTTTQPVAKGAKAVKSAKTSKTGKKQKPAKSVSKSKSKQR